MDETSSLILCLAILLGFLCGMFLFWAILLASPSILRIKQRKLRQQQLDIERAYEKMEEELKQLAITKLKIEGARHTEITTYITPESEKAVDKERQRIAYELHDDTVQRMAAVRLRLEEFSYRLDKTEHFNDVTALGEELNQIMKSLRFVIYGLPQPQFEKSSFSSLIKDHLVSRLNRVAAKTLEYHLVNEKDEFSLSPSVKRELYNLAQEAIQNSLKHSAGFGLKLSVTWATNLEIEVSDNGQGYLPKSEASPGLGFTSMQSRANAIGAKLIFLPSTYGVVVRITMPNPNS